MTQTANLTTVAAPPKRSFVAFIMGIPISIHVRGPRARDAGVEAAVERAFAALRLDDLLFSTYRADSEVSRIRRGELALASADRRIREVARLCALANDKTAGAFSAWLPDADGVVRFEPTGLVKGWAVEGAFGTLVGDLDRFGPHDVLINAGGDLHVNCRRTDTPDWVIGIEDPRDRGRVLRRLQLRTGAVATSGTSARGRHILDPRTGEPVRAELLSATVVGPCLTWADVYATAAFVHGRRALSWLAMVPGYGSLLLATDGTVLTTGA